MAEFGIVVDVFLSLDPASQDVIAEITKDMGDGMAKYIEKEVRCQVLDCYHESSCVSCTPISRWCHLAAPRVHSFGAVPSASLINAVNARLRSAGGEGL